MIEGLILGRVFWQSSQMMAGDMGHDVMALLQALSGLAQRHKQRRNL